MLKFKTSCAVLAYLSSNLLNEVSLSLFRYFEVGLRVCDIVVKKFTFAISSPDEFLFMFTVISTLHSMLHRLSFLISSSLLSAQIKYQNKLIDGRMEWSLGVWKWIWNKRDHVMQCVSWNPVNCCTAYEKLLVKCFSREWLWRWLKVIAIASI